MSEWARRSRIRNSNQEHTRSCMYKKGNFRFPFQKKEVQLFCQPMGKNFFRPDLSPISPDMLERYAGIKNSRLFYFQIQTPPYLSRGPKEKGFKLAMKREEEEKRGESQSISRAWRKVEIAIRRKKISEVLWAGPLRFLQQQRTRQKIQQILGTIAWIYSRDVIVQLVESLLRLYTLSAFFLSRPTTSSSSPSLGEINGKKHFWEIPLPPSAQTASQKEPRKRMAYKKGGRRRRRGGGTAISSPSPSSQLLHS